MTEGPSNIPAQGPRLEVDGRGDAYVRLVWALRPGKPQIVAVCSSDETAERYRPAVERQHPGAVFHVERVPLDHHFGARDIQSALYRDVPDDGFRR